MCIRPRVLPRVSPRAPISQLLSRADYLHVRCEIFSGAPDPAQCQPIPIFQIECIAECSPGTFRDYAGGSCLECGPGVYSKTTGATACRPCSAGTGSASAGAMTCSDCLPGSFSTWGVGRVQSVPSAHLLGPSEGSELRNLPDGEKRRLIRVDGLPFRALLRGSGWV